MKALDRYLVKQFIPIFLAAIGMFMLLIVLIDLFVHLARFLANGATIKEILRVSLYYLPKSLLYALPVSLLFASAYTLGDLYTRNELSTVLCSGVPFWRFCVPLFIMGVVFSVFSFFFEDNLVVSTLRRKNELTRRLLKTQSEETFSNVVIKSESGRLIYAADYYDTISQTLNGVFIIEMNSDGSFVSLIRATKAEWNGSIWVLGNPVIYDWQDEFLRPRKFEGNNSRYNEDPETFKRNSVAVEELNVRDAALLVKDLKEAGLPYSEALSDYHHRFSFSAVSFVVIFLSVTLGGRFKKNILLMTLLTSLGIAVVYYVIEMITMMSARVGLLPPVMGAWIPVVFCTLAGFVLLRNAKT